VPVDWPPVCIMCSRPLIQPGAVVLSPPDEDGMVAKVHVCNTCSPDLSRFLLSRFYGGGRRNVASSDLSTLPAHQ
jgi:hypothetical protein